jgi:hypothetical protein
MGNEVGKEEEELKMAKKGIFGVENAKLEGNTN